MECLIGFTAGAGTLALITQLLTGVALVMCEGSNNRSDTHLSAEPLDTPIHSKLGRIGLLVITPTLIFPLTGLLSQKFCCNRAYRDSCDTRCFVTVFTMIPYALLQSVLVGTSACLFTQNALVGTHTTACATSILAFPLLQWLILQWQRRRYQEDESLLEI